MSFQKISPHSGRGRPPPAKGATPSCTQHPARPLAGRPGVVMACVMSCLIKRRLIDWLGPKPWSPQLFSRGSAPGCFGNRRALSSVLCTAVCSRASVKILTLPLDSATPISVVRRIFWRSVGIYHVTLICESNYMLSGFEKSNISNLKGALGASIKMFKLKK